MQFNVEDLKDVKLLILSLKYLSLHLHICCKDIGIRNLSLWQRLRISFQINYTNAGKEFEFVTFPLLSLFVIF